MRQNKLDNRQLCLEILDSIKNIDARLDELKMHMTSAREERRQGHKDRYASLLDTRFKLVYSFMDIAPVNDRDNIFADLEIGYEHLRRGIRHLDD